MRVYKNSLGIICVEPAEGCLLEKNGQKYKKVYLGINDRAELYTEVEDKDYEEEVQDNTVSVSDSMVLVSPNGKRFKLIVNNDGSLNTKEI